MLTKHKCDIYFSVVRKKEPLIKNDLKENFYIKVLYFVDLLNIRDFNFLIVLKLIIFVNLVQSLLQNSLIYARFYLYSIFLVCLLL